MALNLYIPDEIPETFEHWGERLGLTLSAVNISDRPEQDSDWSDGMIHFSVSITRTNGLFLWRGNYSVGSAHPLSWARRVKLTMRKRGRGSVPANQRVVETWIREYDSNPQRQRTIHGVELAEKIRERFKVCAPLELGDILQSLHCDISGVDQPFNDWASDLGMDSDSRRALRMFEACRETRASFLSLPVADFEAFELCEES